MSVEPNKVPQRFASAAKPQPDPDPDFDTGASQEPAQPPVLRAIVTPLTEQLASVGIDKHSLLSADREHQLALVASAVFAVSACFQWWNGLVRVHGIVNFSATGDGTAFSDWRGWVALALIAACAGATVLQIANASTRTLTQIAAGTAIGALACTVWIWAAYSTSVGLSDGTSIDFGAGFGLYLGLAAAITAVAVTVRRLRGAAS